MTREPDRMLMETRVSDIHAGDEWLIDGAWVGVTDVDTMHPNDRIRITYTLDDEEFSTSTNRGFEVAVVKRRGF